MLGNGLRADQCQRVRLSEGLVVERERAPPFGAARVQSPLTRFPR